MITYGWYGDKWWTGPTYYTIHDCTAEEIATVLKYTLAPIQRDYPTDLDAVAEPGIVSSLSYIVVFCVLVPRPRPQERKGSDDIRVISWLC